MYFDYLATTPIDKAVEKVVTSCAQEIYANPHSSDHLYGYEASEIVKKSAKTLQSLIAEPHKGEWLFTSGATEANNLALKGIYEHALFTDQTSARNKILISAIEHPCVLESARYLSKRGADIISLPVNNDGVVDLDELTKLIDDKTLLLSVMWANNETGVIQPIQEIADICHDNGVIFHSDAAQAVGKIPLIVESTDNYPDLISISGHKLYGPKGIGALWIKDGFAELIETQIHGGGQQNGLRSGTVPVPLCAGLAKAIELALDKMDEEAQHLKTMRDKFEQTLADVFEDFRINGENAPRLPHVSHFQIPHVDMGDLLSACPEYAISRGSACSSEDTTKVSHVLAAMRMEFFAHECLRVSFGRPTTEEEAENLAAALIEIASRIRP